MRNRQAQRSDLFERQGVLEVCGGEGLALGVSYLVMSLDIVQRKGGGL